MTETFIPRGVIPAVLLPFDSDLNIDESAYRSHLRDIVNTKGVCSITINGHSSEVHSLDFDEQRKVLDITLDEVGGVVPIICGIYADGSRQAAVLAKQAEDAGADCLLIFPGAVFSLGMIYRREMVISHYRTIAEATSLPLIAFVYPLAGGMGYDTEYFR